MSEAELSTILGKSISEIQLDEDLFANGILDSLSVIELIEKLARVTGVEAIELAGDLSQISTVRRIMLIANGTGGEM